MEQTGTVEKILIKLPSLYNVILHNDDKTPMDFVTEILKLNFDKSEEEAHVIMMTVHMTGQAVVGQYSKEVAESLVNTTILAAKQYGYPLKATFEED